MRFKILVFLVSLNLYAVPVWIVAPQSIDGTSTQAYYDVASAVNTSGLFMAVWKEYPTGKPYYAMYNGTTWTVSP